MTEIIFIQTILADMILSILLINISIFEAIAIRAVRSPNLINNGVSQRSFSKLAIWGKINEG